MAGARTKDAGDLRETMGAETLGGLSVTAVSLELLVVAS